MHCVFLSTVEFINDVSREGHTHTRGGRSSSFPRHLAINRPLSTRSISAPPFSKGTRCILCAKCCLCVFFFLSLFKFNEATANTVVYIMVFVLECASLMLILDDALSKGLKYIANEVIRKDHRAVVRTLYLNAF